MLGTAEQKFFTVKDIPAADFIRAYADFLKKNNKLERPQWVDYVKTGKSKLSLM
jgi:small subunit ribosomal protein S19e